MFDVGELIVMIFVYDSIWVHFSSYGSNAALTA